ncbi:hypothetical protein [Burkholderia sp. BCC0405]|uniref:hypothetical protein n=1 Tax=Burkholderia sp. BCC0405 TaxID=2676298 RepID=UPI00158E631B|nr:hypothetical protein [Burkholderia sp. BCC0405]
MDSACPHAARYVRLGPDETAGRAASAPRRSRRSDEQVPRAHVKLARSPAAERAFRIAESTPDSHAVVFSSLENMFYIAKTATYLIEKQEK